MAGPDELQRALDAHPKPDVAERQHLIDREREEVFTYFPLDLWPDLALDRYALGIGDQLTFCRMMEYQTPYLGGIKGGSSVKHIIYKRRSDGDWYRAGSLADLPVDEAWKRLREQFVAAFDAVNQERFDQLDRLTLLRHGQSLVTKALSTYFPDAFLPIFSAAHLREYIRLFGAEPVPNGLSWQLNRQLMDLARLHPKTGDWSLLEVTRFLYDHLDPRTSTETAIKVRPHHDWAHWLATGTMRLATELDDLAQYSKPDEMPVNRWLATRLLRDFRDLSAGSHVVAHRGYWEVLAVGTVADDSYSYDGEFHSIKVDWDTSYAQQLDEPIKGRWPYVPGPLKSAVWRKIQTRVTHVETIPRDVEDVIRGLERKNQVILYGPPGTGKTRLAFAAAAAFAGDHVTHATFHPSYGYEDFVEGFKPVDTGHGLALKLTDGVFLQVCAQARNTGRHVLVIDEINRADLARVLGELVTYLEKDKRGRAFTLSTSGRPFDVPPNVFIIGTMNTADRSVAHLDAAIRRRFEFQEIRPDHGLLAGEIGPLDLEALVDALNTRVRTHLGRDHEIGHAFFLRDDKPLDNEQDVHSAFFRDVVPLLEDYTINDEGLLRAILGEKISIEVSPDELLTLLAKEFQAEASTDAPGA